MNPENRPRLSEILPPGVILAFLSLAALGFGDNIRGPLFPELLVAFQLEDFHGSWIFALSSFFGILGGQSSRWFFRRWDRVKTLNFSLLLYGLSLFGGGLSFDVVSLFVFSCLFGFSLGLMGVCQNALVAAGAQARHRRQVLSGLHAMYGLSSLIAPLIVAVSVPISNSWRAPFLVVAFVPLLALVWSLRHVPRGPLIAEEEPQSVAPRLLSDRMGAVLIPFAVSAYVAAEILVSTRLALFLRREMQSDLSESSLAVTLFFAALLVGRLMAAVLPIPWSLRRQLLVALGSSALMVVLGLFGFTWGFVISGFTMAPIYPTAVAFMAERLPGALDSALRLTMSLQSAAIVAMHLSVGWLTESLDIRTALWMGPAFLAFSFFTLVVYEFIFRRHSPRF